MLVAITGGTGFLGSRLAALHRERGDRIRLLKRPGTPRKPVPGAAEIIEADVTVNDDRLQRFVDGADVVCHCAAELRDERLMEAANVQGTRTLARVAAGRIGRWVQVSSAAVYGVPGPGTVTEDSAIQPDSLYGRTKAESEEVVRSAATAGGFDLTILRPTNIFGAGMPGNALYKLFAAIERGWFFHIGSPGAVMNYVHVENVAAAAALCASHPAAAGRTYIVSDEMPLEQLAAIVGKELGVRPSALRLPEPPLRLLASVIGFVPGTLLTHRHLDALTVRTRYASDRIRREIAYNPAVSFETGLRELVRDWKRGRGGG